ncbi:hypothetical protein [Streptomyces sp. NPDC003015]
MTAASKPHPTKGDNYASVWTHNTPVSEEEHAVLAALPHLDPDTETLLAALTVRLCAHAPDGSWDIGMWFNDPTDGRAAHPSLYRP